MVIKVGINGFGRIGRVILRTCCQVPELEVSAINDPGIEIEYVAYLIKFDSTHGKCKENVSYEQNTIKINGNTVKVFHQKLPSDIPWQEAGVQYVVEASGMFTSLEKASGHLASDGVKRVLVTAPSSDVPMLILGVNEDRFNPGMKVISCTSSTLYCLAPLVKLLEDSFGVAEGLVTSIHAMTPSLKPLDGLCIRGKHWRDHRSIHQNIIPAATGACRALGRIIPAVRDKLKGLAFRVPIANVSVLDLSIRLNKTTSVEDITECIEKLKDSALHKIIQVSREQAVSSDFMGDNHSCTLDIDSSLQLNPKFFKLICWYENEYSYACRVVETILFCERQAAALPPPTKLTFLRPRSCKAHSEHQQTDMNKKHVGIECISFPLLTAKPYESHIAKPLVRTVLKRHPVFLPEAKNPREPPREPDKFRKSIENYVKPSRVQNENFSSENSIAIQQNNAKESVARRGSSPVKNNEDLFRQTSSKKLEHVLDSKGVSNEMTGKINSSTHSSLQIDSEKNITFNTVSKHKQLISATENCGDIKSENSLEKLKPNSRREIYINTLKNDLHERLKNLRKKIEGSKTKVNFIKVEKTGLWNEIQLQNQNENYKPLVTNTRSSVTEGVKKNDEFDMMPNSSNNNDSEKASDVIHIVSENVESEITFTSYSEDTNNVNEIQETNSLHNQKDITKDDEGEGKTAVDETDETEALLNRTTSNIAIVDDKLKQRNIVLRDCVMENCVVLNDAIESDNAIAAEDGHKESCDSPKRRSNDPIVIVSEESSGRTSPLNTVTTISNLETYRSKLDIYDKLDSASVSDSNSSFQIYEKKSQIINITDLNYSFEDLNRLDKICRIIEISDELSDKLFAPLDSEPVTSKKRWSFRDLCERIKLDEFCNEVFGKTA